MKIDSKVVNNLSNITTAAKTLEIEYQIKLGSNNFSLSKGFDIQQPINNAATFDLSNGDGKIEVKISGGTNTKAVQAQVILSEAKVTTNGILQIKLEIGDEETAVNAELTITQTDVGGNKTAFTTVPKSFAVNPKVFTIVNQEVIGNNNKKITPYSTTTAGPFDKISNDTKTILVTYDLKLDGKSFEPDSGSDIESTDTTGTTGTVDIANAAAAAADAAAADDDDAAAKLKAAADKINNVTSKVITAAKKIATINLDGTNGKIKVEINNDSGGNLKIIGAKVTANGKLQIVLSTINTSGDVVPTTANVTITQEVEADKTKAFKKQEFNLTVLPAGS